VLPAPFPGYVIAPLQLFSLLPFAVAAKLWTALLLACIACTIAALVRLTRSSAAFVFSALCLSVGIPSLGFGEVVPIFIAALCASALFAKEGKWLWAALCACAGLVEPHIGVAVCVSLFVWRKEARVPLALAGFAALAVSLFVLGMRANVEYVTQVVPYHALSEVGSNRQFSLTVIAHALGASNTLALRAGLVSYAVMVIAGVIVARLAARRLQNDALLVLVPAAAAMVGGSFLHITQVAAAIPLALVLLDALPAYRALLLTAVILLAIPWLWIYQPLLIASSVLFAFFLAWEGGGERAGVSVAVAACVIVALFALDRWSGGHAPDGPSRSTTVASIPAQYAEASWAQANLGYWSSGTAVSFAYRAPTWAGLFAVIVVVCFAAQRPRIGAGT
jgi:hypothetical protein